MLTTIDPKSAEKKSATWKPGTRNATSSSMSALITSRKRPSVSRVSGKVSSTKIGRTTAFTTPSSNAARIRVSVPSIEIPRTRACATHKPKAPIASRIRKPLMQPSYPIGYVRLRLTARGCAACVLARGGPRSASPPYWLRSPSAPCARLRRLRPRSGRPSLGLAPLLATFAFGSLRAAAPLASSLGAALARPRSLIGYVRLRLTARGCAACVLARGGPRSASLPYWLRSPSAHCARLRRLRPRSGRPSLGLAPLLATFAFGSLRAAAPLASSLGAALARPRSLIGYVRLRLTARGCAACVLARGGPRSASLPYWLRSPSAHCARLRRLRPRSGRPSLGLAPLLATFPFGSLRPPGP